jgi:HD-GYP domain-containing protein (c-di-GMP phosphodiesterase class II)
MEASVLSYKKEVSTEALRLGMYVIELDRPWTETSFPFQGFPITSREQIEQLQSYCRKVYIDPEREHAKAEKRATVRVMPQRQIYFNAVPVEQELPVAKEIYRSCEEALRHLILTVRTEGEIDARALTSATNSMIATIQRSPDAMLLLNAVRRKDNYQLTRALDTSILMLTFGRYLQYPTARMEALGLAGMLLDVGMTLLPEGSAEAISREDAGDKGLLETHVTRSVELIRSARGLPKGLDDIVLQHHERQDGEGYPFGLSSDQITGDGAVAAIVDSYSRLTSPQPGAAPLSPSRALSQLHKDRGLAFEEGLLEQFIQCIGIYPVGGAVELNNGEAGLVIAQNPMRRLLPRVMVMLDAEGKRMHPQLILDLMKEPKTRGGEPYRIRRALPLDQLPIDEDDFLLYP